MVALPLRYLRPFYGSSFGDWPMADKKPPDDRPADRSPVAWFFTLEVARSRGDFQRAAEAQRRLEQLGVRIRYDRRGAKR